VVVVTVHGDQEDLTLTKISEKEEEKICLKKRFLHQFQK